MPDNVESDSLLSQSCGIADTSSVGSITYKSTSCAALTLDAAGSLPAAGSGRTGLSYDSLANRYAFNWATPGEGCDTLFLSLASGQTLPAFFNLSDPLASGAGCETCPGRHHRAFPASPKLSKKPHIPDFSTIVSSLT